MDHRKPRIEWQVSILGLLALVGCSTSRGTGQLEHSIWSLNATPLDRTAAELDLDVTTHLAWAEAYRQRIFDVQAPRTIENTLKPYNQMQMHLDAARAECELLAQVHPSEALRTAAEKGEQDVIEYITGLTLAPKLYSAFNGMSLKDADEATRYLVSKILRDFRRAGVDQPPEIAARIAVLRGEIVQLGQSFAKNIRLGESEIVVESPADLAGLPADWMGKHRPAADGKIHVSTAYPDYFPLMTYASNPQVRRRLYHAFKSRGYPENIDVLDKLLSKRYELATILGYRSWAQYITEDKMIGTAAKARSFIDRISAASRASAERDYAALLERKRRDEPDADRVEDWEKTYYQRLVKNDRFNFDPQALRPYFEYRSTLAGLFKLTQKMFDVRFVRKHGLNLWHPDVTAWDVLDGSETIGRFYLDMHPRENKYGHAAQFDYRTGIAGQRLPQAVLVCNFPNPAESPDGVALMEHDEVTTLFHEFGHLLHTIFSGHRRWIGNAGISTEWDFVEAPSQMLEEWCFDLDALRVFARHHETGEAIPAELVEKLRRASDFGKGLNTSHQMFYAAVSLNFYDRNPAGMDTTRLMADLQGKYSPFAYVDDTYFHCSFGHLDQYSAIYYTYMWSLVIAKDMFSRFESEGIQNARTARRYRRSVLDPGGSKPAAVLVREFLGRPYSFDAFERWLDRG